MNYLKLIFKITLIAIIFCSCQGETKKEKKEETITKKAIENKKPSAEFISPLGKRLTNSQPSKTQLENYQKAKNDFDKNPDDIENIVWLGRRTAYLGKYKEAIKIYSAGIKKYPNEPRLYRHRGHRYISIRKFDAAINDYEVAVELIRGKENQIEQDGIPNALNTPISTLHGNIWYHLGLAYYLKQDFEKAFAAYQNGRKIGKNDDNIVSTTHWLYMIQRRMGNEELAKKQLQPIHDNMKIIENDSYYDLCRFYKGMIPRDSLLNKNGDPSGDAIRYGLANWDFYNGDGEAAKQGFEKILNGKSWTSFGYIGAEVDYLKNFKKKNN